MGGDDEFTTREERHRDFLDDLHYDYFYVPERDRTQGLIRSRAAAEIKESSQRAYSYYKSAEKMIEQGQYDRAIAQLGLAIKHEPNEAVLFAERGYCYYRLKHYQEAIIDCSRAINLDPQVLRGNVYNIRGMAREALGAIDDSLNDYDEAFRQRPDDAPAPLYINRGIARFKLGDYRGALSDFDKAVCQLPTNLDAYYGRGRARIKLGDYKNALNDLRKSVSLSEEQGDMEMKKRAMDQISEIV